MQPNIIKAGICSTVSAAVVVSLSGLVPVTAHAAPEPATSEQLAGKTIFLDPGHQGTAHTEDLSRQVDNGRGGTKDCQTTGMTSLNGIPEHTINWDVAQLVQASLKALGAEVVLSRADDTGWGGCVDDRARAANQSGADVAVSIHADSAGPDQHGFHMIVPQLPIPDPIADKAQSGGGRLVSSAVRDAYLAAGFSPANYAGVKAGLQTREDVAGPALTQVPMVFVEMGNGANVDDAARLESREGQLEHAVAITTGVVGFLLNKPIPAFAAAPLPARVPVATTTQTPKRAPAADSTQTPAPSSSSAPSPAGSPNAAVAPTEDPSAEPTAPGPAGDQNGASAPAEDPTGAGTPAEGATAGPTPTSTPDPETNAPAPAQRSAEESTSTTGTKTPTQPPAQEQAPARLPSGSSDDTPPAEEPATNAPLAPAPAQVPARAPIADPVPVAPVRTAAPGAPARTAEPEAPATTPKKRGTTPKTESPSNESELDLSTLGGPITTVMTLLMPLAQALGMDESTIPGQLINLVYTLAGMVFGPS
ncbi:N-acetylmuramoyl-L-alanine amidase [Nocardia sp. NPDC058658]|uniref:N-acetylmuramoyl-L-alanine amidase n=1 Tax=Nocardia sp. NPDC058658 TaxID=3346580 RepID=UPI003669865B